MDYSPIVAGALETLEANHMNLDLEPNQGGASTRMATSLWHLGRVVTVVSESWGRGGDEQWHSESGVPSLFRLSSRRLASVFFPTD